MKTNSCLIVYTRQITLLVAVALLASACGQHSPNKPKTPVRPTTTQPIPAILPGPGTGTPGATGGGLAAMAATWGQVKSFSASYELWEKGSEVETASVKFYFQKPGKYRYEVAKASSSIKNGSTSVFDTRTRKITSRLGGGLSFIPIKGTLDDARTKSSRGWTLDMTDYQTQTQLFITNAANCKETATTAGIVIELANPGGKYGKVDIARATLDPATKLPNAFELLEKGTVVYRKRLSGLKINPSIGSDKFDM